MTHHKKQHTGEAAKIKVGISMGDYNGIGIEVILKTFSDSRIYDHCIPVLYGSSKMLNYYKKSLGLDKVNYQVTKYYNDQLSLVPKVLNVVNCWDEEVNVQPGESTAEAGKYALLALDDALTDWKKGMFDVLVTAPLNKSEIKPKEGAFSGHTEYITNALGADSSLMVMVDDVIKVGLVTNHVPLKDVAAGITKDAVYNKLELLHNSLVRDFGIDKPRIAVFGLNPHAGDQGLLGKEELQIIGPAINKGRDNGMLAFGPFPADGFMGAGHYKNFDAILAMYHDQGLVAFKSISFGNGVNYTAALPHVRTSPDHGTAYDLANKNLAEPDSFRQAIFRAVDIYLQRKQYDEDHANPLHKTAMLISEE